MFGGRTRLVTCNLSLQLLNFELSKLSAKKDRERWTGAETLPSRTAGAANGHDRKVV